MHRPWLATARPQLAGLCLELLPNLVAQSHYCVDFLTPPPDRRATEFGQELERIRETPADVVRDAIDELGVEIPLANAVRRLHDDPERELGTLVDEMKAYWAAAIQPVWPRLRALLDADLGYRATELASGGVAQVLTGLHPRISYAPDQLIVHTPNWDSRKHLAGSGLLLVPCVF